MFFIVYVYIDMSDSLHVLLLWLNLQGEIHAQKQKGSFYNIMYICFNGTK